MPVTKLVVVPEFMVSMTFSGTLGLPFRPVIVQVLAFSSITTSAPKARAAATAAKPSLEGRGL